MSCIGCQKRHVGCHSKCEDYANQKAENEKRKAENRQRYIQTAVTYGYRVEKYQRLTGKRNY